MMSSTMLTQYSNVTDRHSNIASVALCVWIMYHVAKSLTYSHDNIFWCQLSRDWLTCCICLQSTANRGLCSFRICDKRCGRASTPKWQSQKEAQVSLLNTYITTLHSTHHTHTPFLMAIGHASKSRHEVCQWIKKWWRPVTARRGWHQTRYSMTLH